MTEQWLTYREAAERLSSTAEAIRYRALRGRWPRTRGNDGRARIQIPDELPVRTSSAHPVRTPSALRVDAQLINALSAHVETLKQQLAAAELRIERQAAEASARDKSHADEIAAEREKAERARAELAALADRLADIAEANRRRPWWRRALAG